MFLLSAFGDKYFLFFFLIIRLQCDRALLGAQWNGLLVAYHLQKSIGYQDMKLLLRDEVEYVCSYVKCLQPIKDKVLHVSCLMMYHNLTNICYHSTINYHYTNILLVSLPVTDLRARGHGKPFYLI